METTKRKTKRKAKGTSAEGKENWLEAKRQAEQMGIVLTRRRNSKGEYVCYLNKKARKGWLALL